MPADDDAREARQWRRTIVATLIATIVGALATAIPSQLTLDRQIDAARADTFNENRMAAYTELLAAAADFRGAVADYEVGLPPDDLGLPVTPELRELLTETSDELKRAQLRLSNATAAVRIVARTSAMQDAVLDLKEAANTLTLEAFDARVGRSTDRSPAALNAMSDAESAFLAAAREEIGSRLN